LCYCLWSGTWSNNWIIGCRLLRWGSDHGASRTCAEKKRWGTDTPSDEDVSGSLPGMPWRHSSQLKLKHDIWEIDCFSTFLNSSVRISRFILCKLSQDDGPHKSIFKSEVTKIGCFSSPRLDVIPELLITYFVSYAPAYISKNKHDIHYKKIWFYFQLSRWDGVAGVRISLLPVMSCGGQCGEEAVAKDDLPWRTSPPVGKVRRRPWIKLKKIFLKRNCWIPKNVYCRNFVILNKTCKLTLTKKENL
jgi:hypothetical protein